MSNSQKNFMSVRSKLLAAVAMLLVASFMVVSSTYAWFTLSTAPEITGITTQIGANGNLEIALNNNINSVPGNSTGGGNPTTEQKNITWGNIIDLGAISASTGVNAYGLHTIVLKPSVLAVTEAGKVDETPLYTPVYGSDGRVESISKNGVYGTWNGTGFALQGKDGDGYGVRALGTVSTMTAQQLTYKNAASAVKTSLELFNNAANLSLVNNGGALVELILEGVTSDIPSFDTEKLAPVDALLDELEASLPELEKAIKNFMILVVANTQAQKSDAEFDLIMAAFNTNWSNIFGQLKSDAFKTSHSITIPMTGEQEAVTFTIPEGYAAYANAFADVAKKYDVIAEKLTMARETYTEVETTGQPLDWAGFQNLLTSLMKVQAISINGKSYDELMKMKNEDMSGLANWALDVLAAGVVIVMPEGSGVYADIASVSKNINAFFKTVITAKYGSMEVKDRPVDVTMKTTLTPEQITALDPVVIGEPAEREGTDATALITDTYAYVIDFVFRTNAAGSNLLLQQAATDRIYAENTAASATMGGGSYMEFTTQSGFGVEQVKNLMDNIRIVFVNTKTGELLMGGYLDTENAATGSTVKAAVKLQEITVSTQVGGNTVPAYITWGDKLADDNQVITSLGQNDAKYISAYVYLDGTTITNADVAALTELSTTGNLNLQFASSAQLKPMDYSDLKNQGAGAEETTTASSAEETTAATN